MSPPSSSGKKSPPRTTSSSSNSSSRSARSKPQSTKTPASAASPIKGTSSSKLKIGSSTNNSLNKLAGIPNLIQSQPSLEEQPQQAPSWIFSFPDPAITQVEGVYPLFLSTATVDLFDLKNACSTAKPYTFLKRDDLVADLFNRAAVSDFAPLKQQLHALQLPDILLVHDLEWAFGQNYILCLSDVARDLFLQLPKAPAPTEDSTSDGAVPSKVNKPPLKGWISLGSEKEINEELVVPTRKPIYLHLSRKRRKFGQAVQFHDNDCPTTTIDANSNPAVLGKFHRKMQLNVGVQVIGPLVEISSQTSCNRKVNSSIQYEARELDEIERANVLNSDNLLQMVSEACPKIEKVILQNSLVNIFRNEFIHLGEDDQALDQGSHTSLQEYQSFTDLKYSKDKSISSVAWHPVLKGVLAVSCTQKLTLDERIVRGYAVRSKQSLVLIWSFYDPIHPQLILESYEDVSVLKFHPHSPHILAGGCINGQLILWDLSEYHDKLVQKQKAENGDDPAIGMPSKPMDVLIMKTIAASSIEHSHKAAVCDICWSATEVNYNGEIVKPTAPNHHEIPDQEPGSLSSAISQLVSVSLDGSIMFWDLRFKKDLKSLNQTWRPIYKTPVSTSDGSFEYGLTQIALDSVATCYDVDKPRHSRTPTSRVWCATEEGDVIQLDWVGQHDKPDAGNNSKVDLVSSVHYGPVSDVLRSPVYDDIVLSVGVWSCNIWTDRCNVPLIPSAVGHVLLTCGAWSPTRPGVFFIGRADGLLEIWDMLDGTHRPSQTQAVSSAAISAIKAHTYYAKGHLSSQFIAVGDDDGTVHVLEVPRNLFRPRKAEKAFVRDLFDREIKRVAYTAEFKLLRQQMKQKGTDVKGDALLEKDPAKATIELEGDALEKVYLELEASVLELLRGSAAAI